LDAVNSELNGRKVGKISLIVGKLDILETVYFQKYHTLWRNLLWKEELTLLRISLLELKVYVTGTDILSRRLLLPVV
jgi:hypothetical protein